MVAAAVAVGLVIIVLVLGEAAMFSSRIIPLRMRLNGGYNRCCSLIVVNVVASSGVVSVPTDVVARMTNAAMATTITTAISTAHRDGRDGFLFVCLFWLRLFPPFCCVCEEDEPSQA